MPLLIGALDQKHTHTASSRLVLERCSVHVAHRRCRCTITLSAIIILSHSFAAFDRPLPHTQEATFCRPLIYVLFIIGVYNYYNNEIRGLRCCEDVRGGGLPRRTDGLKKVGGRLGGGGLDAVCTAVDGGG